MRVLATATASAVVVGCLVAASARIHGLLYSADQFMGTLQGTSNKFANSIVHLIIKRIDFAPGPVKAPAQPNCSSGNCSCAVQPAPHPPALIIDGIVVATFIGFAGGGGCGG